MTDVRQRTQAAVLLVEDNMGDALLVRTAITSAGAYEVVIAQDGDHAVELLGQRDWDLAVIDLNLPGKDGIEVIRVSKGLNLKRPVIAITGESSSLYQDEAFRAGADFFLKKPLDEQGLYSALTQLCPVQEVASEDVASRILAIGARPADVEAGCGGALLSHVEAGKEVIIFTLAGGDVGGGTTLRSAARAAGEKIGARVVFASSTEHEMVNVQEAVKMIRTLVTELKPEIIYIPTENDREQNRISTHRVCMTCAPSARVVLAYQTPTANLEFHPTHFMGIEKTLDRKAELLGHFAGLNVQNASPQDAHTAARYWGRFTDLHCVEAFEVMHGNPE